MFFCVSGFLCYLYMSYEHFMSISRIHVWVWYKCCIAIYAIQWTNGRFFIKIYLSFYSRKGPTVSCQLRDRWRDIYSEWGLFLPVSSSRSQGVPTLALPCKLVRDDSDRPRLPCSTPILCTLSKNWSCSSYHVVSFWLHTCSTWVPG